MSFEITDRNQGTIGFRPAYGPDLDGRGGFTRDGYFKKKLHITEFQSHELPTAWKLVQSHGWQQEIGYNIRLALVAMVLKGLPAAIAIVIYMWGRFSQMPLPSWLLRTDAILNAKPISAALSILVLFLGGRIIYRFVGFVRREIFEAKSSESYVWPGSGTTTIGLGNDGITVKTTDAIIGIDWTGIVDWDLITVKKKTMFGLRTKEREELGIKLVLRARGALTQEERKDVLIIPESFFGNESDFSLSEFVEIIGQKISAPNVPLSQLN